MLGYYDNIEEYFGMMDLDKIESIINRPEVVLVDMDELDKVLDEAGLKPYSTESAEVVGEWLKETGTTLYERPRETFSLPEAYALAEANGTPRLIVNDLS